MEQGNPQDQLEADPPPAPAARPAVKRPKIQKYDGVVSEVIRETPDTVTLVLETGKEPHEYEAGHFLTVDPHQYPILAGYTAFLEDQKKRKEPPRAYSMCSAPHEKYVAFTVKEELYVSGSTKYPPLLSPLLVRMTAGTPMIFTGFTGPYTLPRDVESRTDHVLHVCAGSGIVPNYSIIKYSLREHPKIRHTLVYSNRTWDDIIYRDALTALAAQHPDRLRIVHTLTREKNPDRFGADVRTGRVDLTLLQEVTPDPSAAIAVTCGPGLSTFEKAAAREKGETPAPRFLETVLDALEALGITKDRLVKESYG
jgi:3-ketosteroid 9alpha-monooxygenase subunit B